MHFSHELPSMVRRAALSTGLLLCPHVYAVNFDIGGASIAFNNRAIIGGAVRLQAPASNTIGKLNLNPGLCPDDCLSFTGDPEPNQRLVDAPGAFVGSNFDDGNLNYDRGDIVSAQARLESRLNILLGEAVFVASAITFFDAVNTNADNRNTDLAFQPARLPRSGNIESQIGTSADLGELFVAYPFQVGDRFVTVSVGEQRVRWGESTFLALGSLDQLNPPDQNRLNFPGADIASVFRPTGMIVASSDLTADLSVELVYQYRWEPAKPAAVGSFFSTNDIAGGGRSAVIGLGQVSEDPLFVGGFKGPIPNLFSSTALNVPVDSTSGEPRSQGQFGGRITGFLEDFNGGTEFGLYALNYHSRLPYASVFATDRSCFRDAIGGDLPGSADFPVIDQALGTIGDLVPGLVLDNLSAQAIGALIACGGGNGASPAGQALSAAFPGEGQEPLPLETLRAFVDYPEDIRMFGVDFNTQFGNWSLAGEYVYQPNMPLLISLSDVIFAGLQPTLPAEDINFGIAVLPGARNAVPDFIQTRFRNQPVEANDLIRGFERMKVHQLGLTGIRVFSRSNWIGADQIIVLTEAGMTYVQDMPSRDRVQFEGGGPNCTHASPGADGTGTPAGAPDSRRLNPTQSLDCFADSFSAGYRIFTQSQFNNRFLGFTYNVLLGVFHDVKGVAPLPAQNFVEGQVQVLAGTEVTFTQGLRGRVLYQGFFGSGDRVSLVQDRDHLSLHLELNF